MANPLQQQVMPQSREFDWVEHDAPVMVGPFRFPASVPVPVATTENRLARQKWMQVPFPGRPPVPTAGSEELDEFDGRELLTAHNEGHLPPHSPDHYALVDQVGRCLIIHASFGEEGAFHREAQDIVAGVEKGHEFFDELVTRSRQHVQEAVYLTEQRKGDEALYEYLLARLMLFGAHLISPSTPGVLYDLGVILFDLAHRLSFGDEGEGQEWELKLSAESRHYLQLGMADEEIRDRTPAFYLLGVNRETLGELDEARSAYERFLLSRAAKLYPQIESEVRERLQGLPGAGSGE